MRRFLRALVVVAGIATTMAAAEIAVRMLDGYRVLASSLVLTRVLPAESIIPGDAARRYAAALPLAQGVRGEWFDQVPAAPPRPPLSAELSAVAEQSRSSGAGSDMFKQWNTAYLEEHVCSGDPLFRRFPGFAFSFTPDEPSLHPPYRFLPDVATPYGLVTNRFGFRGHALDPDKPAGVVRIAFAGASTTVGSHAQAFSYPELIEPWLNLWAQSAAPGVRFEVINAGREGVSSADIAAIVRQEVAPLEPDLVVYHEGANQFTPQTLIEEEKGPTAPPDITPREIPGANRFALVRRASLLFRRVQLGFGAEPRKPRYRVKWPALVDEARPDPDSSDLPLSLPQIVRDLDDIRHSSATVGATLVMTSFIWMVDKGLAVDPVDRAYYYDALNVKLWPVTYADVRRMADFQNRVFQAYAVKRGVPFVDAYTPLPHDISLFTDPIHMTLDGDRLRAWIIFQGLVPLLRAGISSGRLPQPDRTPFRTLPTPASFERTRLECTNLDRYAPVAGGLSVANLAASDESSVVTGDRPKHLVTSPARNGYAAVAPIAKSARVTGAGAVHVRIRVQEGRVAVGVLKADQSAFLIYRTVEASADFVDLYLPVSSMSEAGFLMISNAVAADGRRSIVDVDEIGVLMPHSSQD